jgi:hypothetical protein
MPDAAAGSGGQGKGEWLYGCSVLPVRLSPTSSAYTLRLAGGELATVTYQDLQQYAAEFMWLEGFPELVEGTCSQIWTVFLTAAPVLALGLVEHNGLSGEQLQSITNHYKQHHVACAMSLAGVQSAVSVT